MTEQELALRVSALKSKLKKDEPSRGKKKLRYDENDCSYMEERRNAWGKSSLPESQST